MAKKFDILVVGGGHAGVEAACAAARMGVQTGLVTFDRATIGAMSCNPAIGGLGKGHLVREVDAFDGVIARAADAAAIHYRMLNRSKGSAVWGPRVQADRNLFRAVVQNIVQGQSGLEVVEGEVAALQLDGGKAHGVVLADGTAIDARAVILSAPARFSAESCFAVRRFSQVGVSGRILRQSWPIRCAVLACLWHGSRRVHRRASTGGPLTGPLCPSSHRMGKDGRCPT